MDGARRVLEEAVGRGEVPGAVGVVGDRHAHQLVAACGVTRLEGGAPVTPETVFDLASLTKVVSTLPCVLALVQEGEIGLDDPVRRFFSNAGWFQAPSLGDATVRGLLTHTTGLSAWVPLFARVGGRHTALGSVLQARLEHPVGRVVYSDLGFILLGAIVERVSGQRQDDFARERVFEPLEMAHTGYGAPPGVQVAATEDCGWRGRLLQGEVHDENAWVMDGVAGHAGLFGTAGDVARYARAWLRLEAPFASPELMREAVTEHALGEGALSRRGLGWQLHTAGSSAGRFASKRAFGHTGFTGTSLWVDPEGGWFAVLLTNRVHPSRERGERVHDLRVAFHEALAPGM